MNSQDKQYVETVLKQLMYGFTEKFIVDILPDNQDASELSKEDIMNETSKYVEREVPKIITQLEESGIKSVADMQTRPDILTEFMNKIETDMTERAEKLGEK